MLEDNKTVFHLIGGSADEQDLALTLAENLTEDDSIEMDDVSVKACSNTLAMFDLDESDLVDGVETVSSGVGELTRLQNDGYAYIRP